MTTYGTWLRGDARGWVEKGRVFPPDPGLESRDRERLGERIFLFPRERLWDVGQMMGQCAVERLGVVVLALAVQNWHVHVVIGRTALPVAEVVKRLKESVRWGMRAGQPVWSAGYDKRFCFDETALRSRVRYVERHNEEEGLSARPWLWITDVEEYLAAR